MASSSLTGEPATENTSRGSIFISYGREDIERVRPFAEFFSGKGFNVFWDQQIEPGQLWREALHKGLEKASCVLVVWTAASVSSKYVWDEAENANEHGYLVGVLLDEGITLPVGFGQTQYLNLTQWDGKDTSVMEPLIKPIEALVKKGPNHFRYRLTLKNNSYIIDNSNHIVSEMRTLSSQVRSLGDLLSPGSPAAEDLHRTLEEIGKTYTAVSVSISRFIKPAFNTGVIDANPYLELERTNLRNEIHKARGSCGLILTYYVRYNGLRDYIKNNKPEMLDKADDTFQNLASADDDLFRPLEEIGEMLQNESRDIVNLLVSEQNEIARSRIHEGREKLAPLEDQLLVAIEELQKIESALGYVNSN